MKFLILHEIGHLKYEHIAHLLERFGSQSNYILSGALGTKKYINMESDADCYAASHVGIEATIKGLNALRIMINPVDMLLTVNITIRKRINNVKNMKKPLIMRASSFFLLLSILFFWLLFLSHTIKLIFYILRN